MTARIEDDDAPDYEVMLDEIVRMARESQPYTGIAEFSPQVLAALGSVPRHRFVPPDRKYSACCNRPLSIGHGQTISQPYIVALMTELLRLDKRATVLEIGAGSGYQAAVLAELAGQVYSIEIVEPLAEAAAARLKELGYANVQVRCGDGYAGWPEHAPFDAIMVTAAAPHIPQPLVDQLKPGGRMAIPIGAPYTTQDLQLVEKDAAGHVHKRSVLPVVFVPLTGEH
jgi:protein-L-isoaspartate(D-aspartate) O-methyltransferase